MCSFLSAAWIRLWPWSLYEGAEAVTTSKLRPLFSLHHQSRETKATKGGNVTVRSSKAHRFFFLKRSRGVDNVQKLFLSISS